MRSVSTAGHAGRSPGQNEEEQPVADVIERVRTRRVRVNHRGDWVFVQLLTRDGRCGIGELSHSGDDVLACRLVQDVAPFLVGYDPLRTSDVRAEAPGTSLLDRLRARLAADRAGQTVLSALEQALLDLEGQVRGVPVWRLLGTRLRRRVPLYANINRATVDRSPEGFAANARAAVQEGFRAVKLAPFDDLPRGAAATPEGRAKIALGIERVRAVREAIGPAVELLVDCHARLDEQRAVQVARALEDVRLYWYEEPVSWRLEDGAVLARLRRATGLPIATGESIFGPEPFARLAKQAAADIFMPDVKHAGGLRMCVEIGRIAHEHGLALSPHNPSGPVACAASLHIAAVLPAFTILEYAWGEVPWRGRLVSPAEEVRDGSLAVPDMPGLGITLNEQVLEEHA